MGVDWNDQLERSRWAPRRQAAEAPPPPERQDERLRNHLGPRDTSDRRHLSVRALWERRHDLVFERSGTLAFEGCLRDLFVDATRPEPKMDGPSATSGSLLWFAR